MMRLRLILFMLFALPVAAFADHITGGEIYYTLLGEQNGSYQYHITAKVFMRCNSGRQFNNPAIISIFDKGNGNRFSDHEVYLTRTETLQLGDPNKCITDPPLVCYNVGYYEFTVSLPAAPSGYLIVSQFVFRIAGIRNLVPFYNNIGATYTAEIPGQDVGASTNNSARFVGSDLVIICANNNFSYSFAAEDRDGDQLRYSFCEAYQGGSFRNAQAVQPSAPPYQSVPYNSSFSGGAPLGPNVRINAQTGLITGIAPEDGIYVVTVCVEEIRNGKVIATQRKDLQIHIASCTIAAASLLPEYNLCRDSKTLQASNASTSPLIRTYNWEVLDQSGRVLTQSTTPSVNYTFADTGQYQLKLVINRGGECSDSSISPVRVYPGLKPDFSIDGICANRPTKFKDQSTVVYGSITEWNWNFGDNGEGQAMLSDPTPSFTYRSSGARSIQLRVLSSTGCADTVSRSVNITDRPPLELAFKDTTICIGDELRLLARSSGNYAWTAAGNSIRSDGNTPSPLVAPRTTTLFRAELNQEGCINQDSVLVRVENGVHIQTGPDTTICAGDTVQLRTVSNASHFAWQPNVSVLNPAAAHPMIIPTEPSTRYQVTGVIGGCTETAFVTVRTVPYPKANAGSDTVICFDTPAILNGSSDGNRFNWSQPQTLSNPNSLATVARPVTSTAYVLSAFDVKGCPKPGHDTVLVTVQAPVHAFADRDTSVVVGQPLQLAASGGSIYRWTPATSLSATDVANPVALFPEGSGGTIRYSVLVATPEGCSDTTSVAVKIFETAPSVFVPSAFTPNGDGLNDVLRPVSAGMQQLELFSVYNRWGQLLFSSRDGRGWDGRVGGTMQGSGVYVWLIKAIDFQGRPYQQKGTVTLLR